MTPDYTPVLTFWFEECTPANWWQKDLEFDQLIQTRFGDLHTQASLNELAHWRHTPEGALAEIIVLDQFSRNMYRDTPAAFASDPQALCLAQAAVEHGHLSGLNDTQRPFLLMPYMHSESKRIHEQAVALFEAHASEQNLDFEKQHKAIIDRFGRYPHRNAILSRESTSEELDFLQQPGSSF